MRASSVRVWSKDLAAPRRELFPFIAIAIVFLAAAYFGAHIALALRAGGWL